MYDFSNVANVGTPNFLESVTNPASILNAMNKLTDQTVTTSGPNRFAVQFVATGTNAAIPTFTSYTKSSDTNVAPSGGDDSLSEFGLETATITSQGALSSASHGYNTCDSIVRGFALLPSPVFPSGTVNFHVKAPGGSFTTYNSQTLPSGSATSSVYTPGSAGTWHFQAVWGTDSHYQGSTSADEVLTVNPLPTAVVTPTPVIMDVG